MKFIKLSILGIAMCCTLSSMAQQQAPKKYTTANIGLPTPPQKAGEEQPEPSEIPFPFKKQADSVKQIIDKLAKEYTPQYKHVAGDINLLPYLNDVPVPEYRLPQAKELDADAYYDPFIDKMKMLQKQLEEEIKKNSSIMQMHQKGGNEAIAQQVKQDANQNELIKSMGGMDKLQNMTEAERKQAALKAMNENPMIAQMGGVEKLQNMSESERKAAAMKMAQQNQYSSMDKRDPALGAFMQKMQSDPVYAAKYEKMSRSEQMEEYRKFSLAQTGKEPQYKSNQKEVADGQAKREVVMNAIEVNDVQVRLQQRIQQYNAPIDGLAKKCGEVIEQLRTDSESEEGYLLLITQEAYTKAMIWGLRKEAYKRAIGEFNDFIGKHWTKTNFSSGMTDTNLQLGYAIGSVYEAMIAMATDAKKQTAGNKSSQEFYENNF